MQLDLNTFLPNSNQNWIIKNNSIYYYKHALIPILVIKDNIIWVSVDMRINNPVLKMIKHLINLKVNFFLTSKLITHEKYIYNEDIEIILKNYLMCLTNDKFFDSLFDSGFNYIENISIFLDTYDCMNIFKEVYNGIVKKYLRSYNNWPYNSQYYLIEKEYQRDFIKSLDRSVKLYMLQN